MMQTSQTLSIPQHSGNLYNIVQQQVDLGAHALGRGDADMAATLFRSALTKLTLDQPFYDHLVHNLLLSYKLMIEQLLAAGDDAAAFDYLRSTLNLEIAGEMANDTLFGKKFASVYQDLGLVFFKRRHYKESISCFRRSIAIHESPGFHINLANALGASGHQAELSDFTTEITPQQLGRHIFIACVPKSASTFLKDLLVNLTGYRDAFMVYAAGQNEHELYLPILREVAHLDTVTQQHCRASDANVQLMQAFGIRPVVLVRNIFDSVMSLKDFYDKGASNNTYFKEDYRSLDEEAKTDLIIDNVIPWYFQFVASWSLVEKQQRLDICWLSYEELTSDKPTSLKRVLEFYGLGAARRGVEQRIKDIESSASKIRFNKGIAGRGKTGLSEAQKERVRRLARFYPSTDFGRIGL